MSEGDDKPTVKRARDGDVTFLTHVPDHVDAAIRVYMKEKGLNKRQATLTAFKAIGMPVTDEDLADLRGRKRSKSEDS